ncbi:MAG TPA: N-acetylmuramoyl-L-alanine amidase [Vicinamibacterales bacterium]|nr:N-acetylmuramoyl-L-alanine amidase [Vicinamibacterales bacterium]
MRVRRITYVAYALNVLLLAAVIAGQAPNQGGPLTVLSRDGRRMLPTADVQGRQMVGLDDLATLFQLQIREDAAARAVTATYKNQTLVLTPDQSLVSASGRLVSLPSPLIRQGRRWLVPIEFISRALAPIYDSRLELRPASRLVIVGDLRVPHVAVQYDESPASLRVTFEIAPRANASVTQEPGRLIVRIDADTIDAALPPPPKQQALASSIRATEPTTIQIDLGPRFSSYRASPPTSSGAAAVLTVELLAASADSSAAPNAPGAPIAPSAPVAPNVPVAGPLPVFGGSRPTIGTIVLDPGHGGEDGGVKGAGGALEKNVTLSIAQRIKAAVETRLGMRVVLTHQEDNRLDSAGRAAIANNNKADLFISLHANGSPRPSTRGATIFTLSLDRVGEDARRQSQADREVLQVFGGGTREFALVEWELAQAAHLDGSNAFAGILDQKLRTNAGLASVGLQRAPMRNLAGANMPAVLIEMGYLSNAEDEKLLTSNDFQGRIAAAITDAVVAFRDYLEQGPQAP